MHSTKNHKQGSASITNPQDMRFNSRMLRKHSRKQTHQTMRIIPHFLAKHQTTRIKNQKTFAHQNNTEISPCNHQKVSQAQKTKTTPFNIARTSKNNAADKPTRTRKASKKSQGDRHSNKTVIKSHQPTQTHQAHAHAMGSFTQRPWGKELGHTNSLRI